VDRTATVGTRNMGRWARNVKNDFRSHWSRDRAGISGAFGQWLGPVALTFARGHQVTATTACPVALQYGPARPDLPPLVLQSSHALFAWRGCGAGRVCVNDHSQSTVSPLDPPPDLPSRPARPPLYPTSRRFTPKVSPPRNSRFLAHITTITTTTTSTSPRSSHILTIHRGWVPSTVTM